MISLTITAFYASLLALLFIVLSFNIIRLRKTLLVGIGDGGHASLAKAIRVHANFSEYIPFALFLLACYEISGANPMVLHGLGAALFISRIFHSIGLTKTTGISMQRQVGMILLYLSMLVLAIENIRLFLIA